MLNEFIKRINQTRKNIMKTNLISHTPKYWKIKNKDIIYSTKSSEIICVINGHAQNKNWKEANARLIAAAPELLDACKYALECLNNPKEDDVNKLEMMLDKVIQKAERN